jgi:AraC-like DNA-binding protein
MLSQGAGNFSEALPMSAAYFALIQRGYGRTPHDRAALLAGTGVSAGAIAGPAREITLGQQLRQVRNANRLLDPGWALSVGSRLHAATHGPIGLAAISAPTVEQSIAVMTRFSRVRAPHFRLRLSTGESEVRLVPEDLVDLDDAVRMALLDIVMLSTQGLVEAAVGRPMAEGRFEVSYGAPRYARRYAEYFHAPVHFGCREAAVVIPREWLDLACPLADPTLFETSVRSLVAGERRLEGDRFLAARVEQLIAVPGRPPGSEAVAQLLHVSRRTLARRLRLGGTTYRDLLEARQRGHAEALLRDTRLGIAEVAYGLGYEDAANFGRACRRWFGMSPGCYRDRLLARSRGETGSV